MTGPGQPCRTHPSPVPWCPFCKDARPKGYVLVADRGRYTYILHHDGMWCTRQFSIACGLKPRIFARRIHVQQFVKTRAAGWFLGAPGPVRTLTARTAGVTR